jgi:hypothetical protein
MKKIIFLLLVLMPLVVCGQTKKLSELPSDTTFDADEYFYSIHSGGTYKFRYDGFQNLVSDSVMAKWNMAVDSFAALRTYAGTLAGGEGYWNFLEGGNVTTGRSYTLYPKYQLQYAKIYIGGLPPSYKNNFDLYVKGNTKFNDTVTFAESMKLGSYVFIYDSLRQLHLRDTSGTYTLLDLTELPTTLNDDWTLNKGSYDVVITDGSGNGFSWLDATNTMSLVTDAYIHLDAPYTLIDDSAYIQKLGTPRITTDTICIGDSCYVDMPSGGSGGPGGTYVPGCLDDKDTAYIVGYDSTDRVKYDLIPTVPKGEESIHFITINFTAANVNDGDTLEFVHEQGVDKIIIPIFLIFHYEGSTSVGGTNECALMYGNSNIQYIPFTDLALDSESTDFTKNIPLEYYRGADCSNQALNFRFGADLSGTNRSGWFKLYYSVVNK